MSNSRPAKMDIPSGTYEVTDIDGFDLKVRVANLGDGYTLTVTTELGETYSPKRGYHKQDILKRIREQL